MLKKISLIFFLLYTLYFILYTNSNALELQSPRFKLEVEKPDIDAKKNRSAIYTLETLHGSQALKEFKSNGYMIKSHGSDKDLIFSVSQSIVNLGEISPGRRAKGDLSLSLSTSNELNYRVSMIQEYPLKNSAGETIQLDYTLAGEKGLRPLPNQNKGDFPTVVMTKSSNQPVKVTFSINPPPSQPAGTYESIIDFVAIPGY